MRLNFCALLAAACWWGAGSPSLAGVDTWKTAASGVWGNGANWIDGAAPGTSDAAYFNQAGAYTVSFNGTPFPIQELTVTNSANLTFASASIFDLSTLRVTSASGRRDVSVQDGATLTLGAAGTLFQPDRPLHLVAGEDLRVQSGGTLNVRFGSGVTTYFVNVASGGQMNILGADSTLTTDTYLTVGSWDGVAMMTVQNGGAVLSGISSVGGGYNSLGIVTVTGAGSTLANQTLLTVGTGSGGSGQLIVQDGGSVTSSSSVLGWLDGSSGTVAISGAGSKWLMGGVLSVGDSGAGQLTISDGARMSNTEGALALNPGSSGEVAVSGAASSWTNTGGLYVGKYDSGSLTIQAGGSVSSAFGRIGYSEWMASANPRSTAAINGAGSTWTNSGELVVGGYSEGAMTISGAGSVSSNGGAIGDGAGISSEVANLLLVGNGAVSVIGAGSAWANSGELYVGNLGNGTLAIESGGKVMSKNAAIGRVADRTHANPSYHYSSSGSVNVMGAGSSWTIDGRLSLGGDAISGIAGGAGALDIRLGGKVEVTHDTILFPNSTLKLQGGDFGTTTIDFRGGDFQWTSGTLHIGAYHRDLTNPAGGTLAPGRSAGSTTIQGIYTQQSGAALEIEIGGTIIDTEHDFLNVAGAAIIAGKLELKLINDFTPQSTDAFTVLNASGGIAGIFSNIATGQRLTTVGGLGSFLVHYGATSPFNPNQVVLSAFERSPTADLDNDGDVDGEDLVQWQGDFGQNSLSDADDDGDSDGADFLVWQRSVSAVNPASIPEPSARVLALLGIVACFARAIGE